MSVSYGERYAIGQVARAMLKHIQAHVETHRTVTGTPRSWEEPENIGKMIRHWCQQGKRKATEKRTVPISAWDSRSYGRT